MKRHRSALALSMLATALAGAAASAQSADRVAATSGAVAPDSAKAPPDSEPPQPPARPASVSSFLADIQGHAFVSFAYTYNANQPSDRLNGYRVFDSDANTFNVDVAELVLTKPVDAPGEAGFRLDLEAGGAIPQKTQSAGLSIGESADLQQAFLSYSAPVGSGLRLDFGKFVTHMGAEVIEGYDGYNDNYSRSLLFNYTIPFTHTGVRAGYTLNKALSAMLLVVNGWDNVQDNNAGKSVGAQLALTPAAPVAVYLNYIGGPEKTDTNGYVRNVFDVVATWKAMRTLTLGLNGDYGVENGASLAEPGRNAVWKGVAGYARFDVTRTFALAFRGETLHDEGGTRFGTGVSTTVSEATVTPTLRFGDRFVFRGEMRYDRANDNVFVQQDGTPTRHQMTIAGNVIFVY
jgi:Putative beta-barrel porin-2, OmpL-like. bbp2